MRMLIHPVDLSASSKVTRFNQALSRESSLAIQQALVC
jgi:hypothetical protein